MAKNEAKGEAPAGFSVPATPSYTETMDGDHGSLADELAKEMAREWQIGRRPIAEEFLNRHPFLWDKPEQAIQLIYEEICLRAQHQDTACWENILERFPQWQEQLQVLLDCHQIVGMLPGPPTFPEAGEILGEFELISELGRGVQGRVFLAKQQSLAERLVVLKFSALAGDEHLSLARLQHTNIVPLYSMFVIPARNLRALCMPYFGGKTLADLLTGMQRRPVSSWSGAYLLESLGGELQHGAARTPSRRFLSQSSHVQAMCWIGMCIADALKYAHDRGLLHLDIKPSNLLVAEDGQPMLLDLHLAQKPIGPGDDEILRIGGTPGYMAPEHTTTVDAIRRQEPIKTRLDQRADIYALGMTLYEGLAGTRSDKQERLDLVNPQVSRGLADIVERCLAKNPTERYADAEQLAGDLRRHLNNLPLEGVSNRSLNERWQKWRRRRPHLLAIYTLAALIVFVAITAIVTTASQVRGARRGAEIDLQHSRDLLKDARYDDAAETARNGLSRLSSGVWANDIRSQLEATLKQSQQLRSAEELHKLVDRVRALYDVDWMSRSAAGRLHGQCRQLWQNRAPLVAIANDRTSKLASQVRADLLDIAILTAALEVSLQPPEAGSRARKNAAEILTQAEGELGPNRAVSFERATYLKIAGPEAYDDFRLNTAESSEVTSWEHLAFGRALLRSGRYKEASREFRQALKEQPQSLWPNFYEGICAYRTHRYLDAAIAFTVCLDQAPLAECYYNRALTFSALKNDDRALEDYDRALQLRAEFPAAAFNRGLLHYRANRLEAARADFIAAVAAGLDPSRVPSGIALPQIR